MLVKGATPPSVEEQLSTKENRKHELRRHTGGWLARCVSVFRIGIEGSKKTPKKGEIRIKIGKGEPMSKDFAAGVIRTFLPIKEGK